jgi:hypothetical protein
MHLKFERRTMLLVAATPVILCVFLMLMLIPDGIMKHRVHTTVTAPSTTMR